MISRNTKLFKSAKWAYQPVKQINQVAKELAVYRSRRRVISDYFNRPGFKGLQIGSGPQNRDGWLNSDVVGTPGIDVALDIEKPLPFDNGIFDAIYGSEVIEHVPRESVEPFLREAYRVLKHDGVLRLTTPDVKAVCEICLGLNPNCSLEQLASTWLEDGVMTPDCWMNSMFRNWGHKWIWDYESLQRVMNNSGFSKIARVKPQVTLSTIHELENQETRYGMPPPEHCWEPSMIIEASK